MKQIFFISIVLIQISFLNTSYSLAQNFAPLNLGNVWVWEDEWGTRRKSIVIDTNYIFNDKYYSIILYNEGTGGFLYSYFNNSDSLFYRYQSNYPYNNGDLPYYKLNCALGDTFSFPLNQYANVTVAVIDTYLAQVFDTILTVKILHRNAGGLVEHYQAWTDEIGFLSEIEHPWGTVYFTLKGCIINGRLFGDTTIVVGIEEEPIIINSFRLYQNYPNPYNSTTNIIYELKELAFATLKVYDLLGNEISILVNEEKHPGKYSIKFNGSNLVSGVYFYKLTIGGNTQIRKMILLR